MIIPRPGQYAVIYIDPPWKFATRSPKGIGRKSPEFHYPTMRLAYLKALPMADVAAPDCMLVLWATWPMLPQALDMVAAWGFTYSTGGAWAKRSSADGGWQFGPGYRLRTASEPLILASRGAPVWRGQGERNLWVAPVREHSRKPEQVREMIERATDGPRLEIFGRQSRPGWDVAGNEPTKFDGVGQ